jgi:hypothetical protein
VGGAVGPATGDGAGGCRHGPGEQSESKYQQE